MVLLIHGNTGMECIDLLTDKYSAQTMTSNDVSDKKQMQDVLNRARGNGYTVVDFTMLPNSVNWDELEADDGEPIETIPLTSKEAPKEDLSRFFPNERTLTNLMKNLASGEVLLKLKDSN